MKLARFLHDGVTHIGVVNEADGVVQPIAVRSQGFDPMIAFIERQIEGEEPRSNGAALPLQDIRLLPPITAPSKNILCVGKNYRAHAFEFAGSGFDGSASRDDNAVPDAPIIFSKAPCSMTGAYDDILSPAAMMESLDYEAELGVVIGKGGRAIPGENAYDHVWGYTVINDVTARIVQSRHKQWLLGKSVDTFCPIGPWIVSADELNPEALEISCWVNGERRQHASTRDLIFDIPSIIEVISASMTLQTGDIIATGTPAGVGIGFDPPQFLREGDVVRVEISGIGALENRVLRLAPS